MNKDYRELFQTFLYEVSTDYLTKGLGKNLLNKKGNKASIHYPPALEPCIKVTISNLARALDLVLQGKVTSDQLQEWADIVYMLDDVFEIDSPGSEEGTEILKTLLQQICTPEINEPLTKEFIEKTRKQLEPYLLNEIRKVTSTSDVDGICKSDMGKLFFQSVGGKAKFLGQFAEVAQDMGPKGDAESFRILATHVGEGIPSVSELVPTVENVYKTALEIPSDYRIDPPLFIPILGREPLEPTLAEVSYAYAGRVDRDNPHFKERRSPRLENPNAQLDHFQEVGDYFNKQPESQKKAVEDLVAQIPEPMSPECKINVFVPAAGHQEGDNIYRTLELYKNQKEMDGAYYPEIKSFLWISV